MEHRPAISLVTPPAQPGVPDAAERLRRGHELLDELLALVATMRDEALTSTRPPPERVPEQGLRRSGLRPGELRAAFLTAGRAPRPVRASLFRLN